MAEISVIMPAYNTEKYIRQSIESILNQTYEDFELIVVDDGSTDDTLNIIENYKNQDSRVKLIKQQNEFAGVARNNGLKIAEGKYVMFLDSDDFFESDMLSGMYNQITKNAADICVCTASEYDEQTKVKKEIEEYLDVKYIPNGIFCALDCTQTIFKFTCDAPWNKMYRKAFLEEVNLEFQQVKRANDTKFVNMSLVLADRITILPVAYINYRINHGGNLQSSYADRPYTFYDTMMAFKEELIQRGIYETYEKAYVNKALSIAISGLERMQTYESFKDVFNKMKDGMLEELGVLGHEAEYFFNEYDYNQLQKIMKSSAFVMYNERKIAKKIADKANKKG